MFYKLIPFPTIPKKQKIPTHAEVHAKTVWDVKKPTLEEIQIEEKQIVEYMAQTKKINRMERSKIAGNKKFSTGVKKTITRNTDYDDSIKKLRKMARDSKRPDDKKFLNDGAEYVKRRKNLDEIKKSSGGKTKKMFGTVWNQKGVIAKVVAFGTVGGIAIQSLGIKGVEKITDSLVEVVDASADAVSETLPKVGGVVRGLGSAVALGGDALILLLKKIKFVIILCILFWFGKKVYSK